MRPVCKRLSLAASATAVIAGMLGLGIANANGTGSASTPAKVQVAEKTAPDKKKAAAKKAPAAEQAAPTEKAPAEKAPASMAAPAAAAAGAAVAAGAGAAVAADPAAMIAQGKKIAMDRSAGNCIACHVIPGGESPGTIGPPLIAIQARIPSKEKLKEQLWDSTKANPVSPMPPFGKYQILTDEQLNQVVEFVWSL